MTCISSEHGITYMLQKASDRDQQVPQRKHVPHGKQVPHNHVPATTVTGKGWMLAGGSSGTHLPSSTPHPTRIRLKGLEMIV